MKPKLLNVGPLTESEISLNSSFEEKSSLILKEIGLLEKKKQETFLKLECEEDPEFLFYSEIGTVGGLSPTQISRLFTDKVLKDIGLIEQSKRRLLKDLNKIEEKASLFYESVGRRVGLKDGQIFRIHENKILIFETVN